MILNEDGSTRREPIDVLSDPTAETGPRPSAQFNQAIEVYELLLEGLDPEAEYYEHAKRLYEQIIASLKALALADPIRTI